MSSANARLSLRGRELLIDRMFSQGWLLARAASHAAGLRRSANAPVRIGVPPLTLARASARVEVRSGFPSGAPEPLERRDNETT
jgi:hypothetical protein